MPRFFIFCFLHLFNISYGQILPNQNFKFLETLTCPFDSSKTVVWPESWMVFQTKDGSISGEIDSSACLSVQKSGPNGKVDIPLGGANATSTVFVKSRWAASQSPDLVPNLLYHSGLLFQNFNNPGLKGGVDCPDGFCTGGVVSIQIPDSTGNGHDFRQQKQVNAETIINPACFSLNFCWPTEKFVEQKLATMLFKFTWEPTADFKHDSLRLWSVDLQENPFTSLVDSIIVQTNNWTGNQYEANISEVSPFGSLNFIAHYGAASYPSPTHPFYLEAKPEPNEPTPQTIVISVNYDQTLEFQPFTYLRGGLVEGSDTARQYARSRLAGAPAATRRYLSPSTGWAT